MLNNISCCLNGITPVGYVFIRVEPRTNLIFITGKRKLETTQYWKPKPENILTEENKNQLCSKIDLMHKLGYIHNDLKYDNILIDKDHGAYIIDFGLSQHIEEGKNNALYNNFPERFFMLDNKTDRTYSIGNDIENRLKKKFPENLQDYKQICKKADWTCESKAAAGSSSPNVFNMCKNV